MKFLFAIVAIIIFLLVSLILTSSHWWRKYTDVSVTINGQPASNVSVYRSHDKAVLVHQEQDGGLYVIFPESRTIGIPNRSNFFIFFGYAYSRDKTPPIASMGKAEIEPQLVIENEYLEFNAADNSRVRLIWR